ncbi:MAG: hypothetical protein GY928_36280 [Colwellia sp.]|nr:hypothetical protein [Colwellia sp.]
MKLKKHNYEILEEVIITMVRDNQKFYYASHELSFDKRFPVNPFRQQAHDNTSCSSITGLWICWRYWEIEDKVAELEKQADDTDPYLAALGSLVKPGSREELGRLARRS